MKQLFNDCFFIKKNSDYKKICLQNITYLEANGDYVNVYVDDQNVYLIRNTLSKVEKLLPASIFLRIHRSYIVQLNAIESINFTEGILRIGDKTLPISRQNRKKLGETIVKLE